MEKSKEQPKKCFCARCFHPIEQGDKVDIDGQNFHRACCTCCVCRKIPTSLKMFYGHVFCAECFKNHVLNRAKGENPCMHANNWWTQFAPGPQAVKDKEASEKEEETSAPSTSPTSSKPGEVAKRCICARCLQACDEGCKVDIGGQSFHPQCARCYFCHCVPTNNVKIYYGQVFCEECFNRHVLGRNKDNPAELVKTCFDQWQNNPQFGENMAKFMASSENKEPVVVMMGGHSPFCRCGGSCSHAPHAEWMQTNEPRKSAAGAASASLGGDSWDLPFEEQMDASDHPQTDHDESANQEKLVVAAAQKIEKLTKYLHGSVAKKCQKKWENFEEFVNDADSLKTAAPRTTDVETVGYGWVDWQDPSVETCCNKCLWQCGPIFVDSVHFQKEVMCCGENLSFK